MKVFIYLLFLLTSQVSFSGVVNQYQAKDGTTILTSKAKNDDAYTLIKQTHYKDIAVIQQPTPQELNVIEKYLNDKKYNFILTVFQWSEQGSVGMAPLMPIYTHRVVVFQPVVFIKTSSNGGFIDLDSVYFDEQSKDYQSCMSKQNVKTTYVKNNYKLSKSIEFPKNTKMSYAFACSSIYVDEKRPAFTTSEVNREVSKLSKILKNNPKLRIFLEID